MKSLCEIIWFSSTKVHQNTKNRKKCTYSLKCTYVRRLSVCERNDAAIKDLPFGGNGHTALQHVNRSYISRKTLSTCDTFIKTSVLLGADKMFSEGHLLGGRFLYSMLELVIFQGPGLKTAYIYIYIIYIYQNVAAPRYIFVSRFYYAEIPVLPCHDPIPQQCHYWAMNTFDPFTRPSALVLYLFEWYREPQ